MPSKTVLSVGQCRPDNAAITHFLTSNFDVRILRADLADEALQQLSENHVDLVLINRKLDADYSDGMLILEAIKSNPAIAGVPVMLVSNFPEWQEKAVSAGGIYGFGKSELRSADAISRVAEALGLKPETAEA
ncbi:MAG: hypothetical protein R3C19_02155 [Planctomycetaceae bacterium]